MTTDPTGLQITFEERIADILHRYNETDIVAKAIHEAIPVLALSVKRIQEALATIGSRERREDLS